MTRYRESDESDQEDIGNSNEESNPLNDNDDTRTPSKVTTNAFPIDRGWAWVVLSACVFEIFIFGGIMRSFGVLFLEYQRRFNSSASETATMSLIQNIVVSISALFVMTVGLKRFSCRAVVIFGGVFLVSSYLITAFTTDLTVFYLVQGVLGGVGLSCAHPPMFIVLGTYFSKHKGLANSIFTAGASVGGLVFAPIVIKMFEEYGFTGTLLIVSAMMGNIFVAGCILRPPEFYTKRTKVKNAKDEHVSNENISSEYEAGVTETCNLNNGVKDPDGTKISKDEIHIKVENLMYKRIPRRNNLEMARMLSHDPSLINKANGSNSPVLERIRANSVGNRRVRTLSEQETISMSKENGSLGKLNNFMKAVSRSQVGMYVSGATVCGSFVDISIPTQVELTEEPETNLEVRIKDSTCLQHFYSGLVSVLLTIFDLNLLKDKSFLYFLLMAFCGVSSAGLIPIFIPTYANEIGVANEQIGLLVSIVAALDFIAKITMGVVADRRWLKRNVIVGIAFFTVGTACHFVRFIKTFKTMIIFVIIAGICCGQYMSTFAVMMSDLIGQERFKQSMGFTTLTHGISIATFFPLTGLIRDSTKSYINALHLTGGLAYVAGFCAFTLPIVHKWVSPKQKEKEQEMT